MEALYAVARGLMVEILALLFAGCVGVPADFVGGVKIEDIEDVELLSKFSITLLNRRLIKCKQTLKSSIPTFLI